MAEDSKVILLVIFLTIYISVLALGLIRMKYLTEFGKQWRIVKIFYISQISFFTMRIVGLLIVVSAMDLVAHKVSYILLEFPTAFGIVPFLYLGLLKYETTHQGHISSHLTSNFISGENPTPKFENIRPVIIGFMIAYILFGCLLIIVFLAGSISGMNLEYIIASLDIAFGFAILLEVIILQAAFSGIPTKSVVWAAKLRKVNLVTIFWCIGKLVSGIFDIFRLATEKAELINFYEDNKISTLELSFDILTIFMAEILSTLLTLDYAFISMFRDEPEPKMQLPTVVRASMVSINPYIKSEEVTIGEEIPTTSRNLGKLYNAQFLSKEVIYRLIQISNISAYVIEEIQAEMESYKTFYVDGIVRVFAIVIEKTSVGLVYPFYKNKSLYNAMHIEKVKYSYPEKLNMLRKIAEILVDIHGEGKVHGHLTSHNILLESKNDPVIADLGFHKLKKYVGIKNNYSYKSAWSSPEMLENPRTIPTSLQPSTDIYSFGMICWEVLSEQEPFPGFSIEEIKKNVVDEGARPKIPANLSNGIVKLVQSCFNTDCSTRPESLLLITSLK